MAKTVEQLATKVLNDRVEYNFFITLAHCSLYPFTNWHTMGFLIDFLKLGILLNLIKIITDFFRQLVKSLTPPSAFSWQTLIFLSVFSYFMAYLSTYPLRDLLASMGWVFLIFGVSWVTADNEDILRIYGFSLGPWITGALVCVFVFGTWKGDFTPATLICWPPISAILASVREFFDAGLKFKIPQPAARQNIVILFLVNLIISCWFQFYFITQDWINQYPILLADDFSKSAFVMKIENPQAELSRGTLLLNSMEQSIKRELESKPWPQAERWLLPDNLRGRLPALEKQVQKQLPWAAEDLWWRFEPKVSSTKSGYNLQLQAIWKGPSSQKGEYYIKKSCQITPTYRQLKGATNPTMTTKVNCQA